MKACGSIGKTDAYIRMMLRLCLCVCMGVKSVMAGGVIGRVVASIGRSTGVYHCAIWRFAMYVHDCTNI